MGTAPASTRSRDIPPIEQLPQDDQAYLRELIAKVNRGISPAPEGQGPKEYAFHEAVAELNDYIIALRSTIDVGFREPGPAEVDNAWAKAEPRRPSVPRVQDLAYNFLGAPGVKRVSLGIHAQKLVAALPHFRRTIASSLRPRSTLSSHFADVMALMASSMVTCLDKTKLDQYLRLGMIMGYRTAGMRWPADPALRHFAGQGVETFIQQLERVIRQALADRVDPSERVRAELLEKEGTIYRLMRVSFDRVNGAVKDIQGKSIEDARRILADGDYSAGACPGLVPVDNVGDGAQAKRPIAYEYAITILRHTPVKLLQPA